MQARQLLHGEQSLTTYNVQRVLAYTTKSGELYFPEFVLAMYLCNLKLVRRATAFNFTAYDQERSFGHGGSDKQ